MDDTLIIDGDPIIDINADGESEIVIAVGHETVVHPIEVTENGHYEPESGVDGFSSIDVDVRFDGYLLDDIASGTEPSGDIIIHAKTIRIACFWDCQKITSIIFEETELINTNAFYGCSYLTSVYGKNVITINNQAFMNCIRMTDVKLPKVQTLGATVFRQCGYLKSICLPSCTSIGTNCFLGCTKLTDIYLPNDVSTYTGAPWGANNATVHYNTQFDENGEPIL